jgi:hypothetical protein
VPTDAQVTGSTLTGMFLNRNKGLVTMLKTGAIYGGFSYALGALPKPPEEAEKGEGDGKGKKKGFEWPPRPQEAPKATRESRGRR